MPTLAERLAEPDVAGLPDWRAAEVLNTPDPVNGTKRVDVDVRQARGILLATGEWAAVKMASRLEPSAEVPPELVGAAITCIDALDPSQTTVIESGMPEKYARVQAMLDGLVQAQLVSQASADALLALADVPRSWAEANGITVDARAVGLARGGV